MKLIIDLLSGPWAVAIGSILGVLVGAILGHRLTLANNRRNERNAVAQRMRAILLKRGELDPIDADLFLQMLTLWRRWQFGLALERHRKAKANYQQHPDYGTITYTDSAKAEIEASVAVLLHHTRWR